MLSGNMEGLGKFLSVPGPSLTGDLKGLFSHGRALFPPPSLGGGSFLWPSKPSLTGDISQTSSGSTVNPAEPFCTSWNYLRAGMWEIRFFFVVLLRPTHKTALGQYHRAKPSQEQRSNPAHLPLDSVYSTCFIIASLYLQIASRF